MELKQSGNVIEIYGVIKTAKDAQEIKEALDKFRKGDRVIVRIYDSFALLSSVIGEMLKLIKDKGVLLSIETKQDILYELFDNLNLIKVLNVTKI